MAWFDKLLGAFGGGSSSGAGAQQPQQDPTMNPIIVAMANQIKRQQQRQREQARADQAQQFFQSRIDAPTQGNYQPRQQGGLYPTVQKYGKDWEKYGNMAMGALGAFLSGRQSDATANEIDEERIPAIMDTINKLGDPNRPDGGTDGVNDSALRAFLGMAGGKDFANITKQRRLQSTKEDENGYIWNIYSDGTRENTGVKANYNSRTMNDAAGNVYSVGTSGAGRGVASPVMQKIQEIFNAGNGAPPLGEEGGFKPIDRDTLHQRQMQQESGGDQGAVSPKGARGLMQLMPATARELEQRLGLPMGSTDSDAGANEKAGRAYMDDLLKKNNGDQVRSLVDYNWGMGNAAKWDGNPESLPAETRDYVQRILGPGAFAKATPQQPTAIPFRQQTAAEKAGAEAAAKAQAEAANVNALATVKGAETMASEQAKNTAAAQAGLGKVQQVGESVIRAIDDLANAPGLSQIVGGKSMYSRVDDKMADRLIPLIAAGTPVADAYAKYSNLQGANFLQAFESLKGGGQITEKEGEQAKAAFARLQRSQSEKEFRAALADLRSLAVNAIDRAKRKAAGGSSSTPALPAGWSVKVK